jgi:hypothetical protein
VSGHANRTTPLSAPALALSSLVLFALAGALVNIVSAAYWSPWSGFTRHERVLDASLFPDGPPIVGAFRKVVVPLPVWRPLRVTLDARAPQGPRTLTIEVPPDSPRISRTVDASPVALELLLTVPAERDGRVTLYCAVEGVTDAAQGVTLRSVRAAPVWTVWSVVRYGGVGAASGALLWVLTLGWSAVRGRAGIGSPLVRKEGWGEGPGPVREAVIVAAASALLLTAWAVIKPPLQAPDEPQHVLRATSVPLAPWVAGVQSFAIDGPHAITLVWGVSPVLHGLIQHRELYLSRDQVEALKKHPHVRLPDNLRITTAVASYPPLFYWYVFGASELARALGLTPWQTLHLLRFAVVLLVAPLWAGVFLALRHAGYARSRAAASVAVILGVPMYTFLGSSVNPDAVVVPLAIWLTILCWHGLWAAPRGRAIAIVALGLLFTKPSSLQVVLAILGATTAYALWRRESWRHALEVGRTLGACTLAAMAAYYAWAPPALSDGDGLNRTALQYLVELLPRIPRLWVMLWGDLGWLEYHAAPAFYVVLLVVTLACIVWMAYARLGWVNGAPFFAVYTFLLTASTLTGEFTSLHRTGHMLQGRYFLSGLVCAVPVMAHGPLVLRVALGAAVAALHVTLFWLTFVRYWHADFGAFFASLPF